MRSLPRPRLIVLVWGIWTAVCSVLVYWQWFDNPVIYYDEDIIVTAPVRRGDKTLTLHSRFCLSRPAIPNSGNRVIKNAFTYLISDSALVAEIGCYDFFRDIPLPPILVLGPHTYNFSARFQVNPIKTVIAFIRPVTFEVIE